MATSEEHAAVLDQLQKQLNLVLEQTGRVFAALSANPKATPTAQVTKLQHAVPVATDNFHDALDKLDTELQLAQIVMRRDLAVCRERSGQQAKAQEQTQAQAQAQQEQPNGSAFTDSNVESPAAKETETQPAETEPPKIEGPTVNEDIIMEDVEPDPQLDSKPPALSFDELIADDKPEEPEPPLTDTKPSVAAHTLNADVKPTNGNLSIDTKPSTEDSKPSDEKAPSDDDKAPDTANDLDSLFNDPMSAGGGENQEFNFDTGDGSNDLDFGFGTNFDANGADNDNISSLLPGLEDYANTQPNNGAGADLDLNALLGVGDGANGMDSQGAGEQRDTTFDDLLDMANFGDGGMEGDGNNNNNNADFDFDSLFN